MDYALSLVTPADFTGILAFERTNRAFFEGWVPPRPIWFFENNEAYLAHMIKLTGTQNTAKLGMYVLQDLSNQIVARINLSFIQGSTPREASLGFRVAQAHTGKGLAALAINLIEPIATKQHAVQLFNAFAASNNPGSYKSLLNAGFTKDTGKHVLAELHGKPIRLQRFIKPLT